MYTGLGLRMSLGSRGLKVASDLKSAGGRACILFLVLGGLIPVPIGWWVGLGLSTNKPEGGSQTDACQHQCPYGEMSSQNCAVSASVPKVSSS